MPASEVSNANITLNFNSQNAIKEGEKAKQKFSQIASGIKKAFSLGSMGAGLLGGFSMKKAYDDGLKLANLSDKFTLPIEEVSKFNNVLSLFGGNADSAEQALDSMSNAIMELKTTGGSALKNIASQTGINLYDMNGNIKDGIELFEDLRQSFKRLNKDGQIKVASELGLNSPEYLRILRASDEEYAKMVNEAKNMTVMTEKQKENTLKLQRTFASIKSSFTGVGISLLEFSKPFIDVLDKGLKYFNSLDEETKKIVATSLLLAPALSPALNIFKGLIGFGGLLNNTINIFGSGLTKGILKWSSSLGILTVGLYGAYKLWEFLGNKADQQAEKTADYLNSDEYDEDQWKEQIKESKTLRKLQEEGNYEELEKRKQIFLEISRNQRGEKYQPLKEERELANYYQPIPSTPMVNNATNNNINNNSNTNNYNNRNNNITTNIVINANNASADEIIKRTNDLKYNYVNGVR